MSLSKRDESIIENLKIRPINHGQVFTFQVAIPPLQVNDISPERLEDLKQSLVHNGSNLIPLIVRRTDAYTEDEQFEVVYGADWCLAAKELDIEKLWVWVFDLTDEQADTTRAKMETLVNSQSLTLLAKSKPVLSTASPSNSTSLTEGEIQKIGELTARLFDQRSQTLSEKIDHLITTFAKPTQETKDNHEQVLESLFEKLLQPIADKIAQLQAGQESILAILQQGQDNKKININTATLKQLKGIRGIGEKTAKNIISLRDQKGGFTSISELTEISKISQYIVDQLKSHCTFD